MKVSRIDIRKTVGKKPVSRDDGKVVYKKIRELWKKSDQIWVVFANRLIASVSFIDQAFGHLALEYPLDELKRKLKFVGMERYDKALLNDIIVSRVRQKKLDEREKPRSRRAS